MRGYLLILLSACSGSSSTKASSPSSTTRPAIANTMSIEVLDQAPADALVLDVRGYRWDCEVTHLHGIEERTLRVPAGRVIKLVSTPEPAALVAYVRSLTP